MNGNLVDRQHRMYETLGILMKFHAFPEEVMGKYCLVEALVPSGLGAPPNHHAGETESFYMIDGEIEFMIDGQVHTATAGQHVSIPDGAIHAFSAVGDKPARVLILNAPGHMHAQFFTELGEPVDDDKTEPDPMTGPPDLEKVLEVATRNGMAIELPAHAADSAPM